MKNFSSIPVASVPILGIPIFDGTINEAVSILVASIQSGARENRCVSATGAHGFVTGRQDPSFRKLLGGFFMNLPDGMPGVWVARRKGASRIERCYGPDFFASVMERTAGLEIRHFLCGGMEGVPEKLAAAVAEKFGNRSVVGTVSPPFRELTDSEMRSLARDIDRSRADVVWIGISTPKQEKFAARLACFTNMHFIVTVGAAFDFHIGNVRQAPLFMQRNGLEWLFRLCVEPRRLWRRYAEIVPLFVYYNVLEAFSRRGSASV